MDAWKTFGDADSSTALTPGALNPTAAGLRGWTMLTLCHLLVMSLPPPPFSALVGSFQPRARRASSRVQENLADVSDKRTHIRRVNRLPISGVTVSISTEEIIMITQG